MPERKIRMEEKNTRQLEDALQQAGSIEDFLQKNKASLQPFTLAEYLEKLLAEKHLDKAAVVHASGLERSHAYHIFAGKKHPSRPKVLALALAMQLTPKETQYLLHYAGVGQLYVRDPWDSILWHALERHLSTADTNLLLDQLNELPLLE